MFIYTNYNFTIGGYDGWYKSVGVTADGTMIPCPCSSFPA